MLTQELIELPERFARFESYVMQRLESLESNMERQFTEVRGDLGRLQGQEYERRVSDNFASHVSIAFGQHH
ncbi:hypothetical protein, partial [Methylobacterium crusticola]|uniref:hypothetical protein n=1 Tax=Methylobacterium crusticola TaxID=1697972 RepID=UPI001EE18832